MSRDYLHYINDGKKWMWYWNSWKENDVYYCTNSDGEGIFIVDIGRNERKQILGTCQFSLVGLKDPRRKIRSWMNDR